MTFYFSAKSYPKFYGVITKRNGDVSPTTNYRNFFDALPPPPANPSPSTPLYRSNKNPTTSGILQNFACSKFVPVRISFIFFYVESLQTRPERPL